LFKKANFFSNKVFFERQKPGSRVVCVFYGAGCDFFQGIRLKDELNGKFLRFGS